MPQRCSYCGKTEKQHKGVACIDPALSRVFMSKSARKVVSEHQGGTLRGIYETDHSSNCASKQGQPCDCEDQ